MTYKEMVVKTVRMACQDLSEQIEDLVPDSEGLFEVTVKLKIPTLSNRMEELPTFKVAINGYPKRTTVEKMIDLKVDE